MSIGEYIERNAWAQWAAAAVVCAVEWAAWEVVYAIATKAQ